MCETLGGCGVVSAISHLFCAVFVRYSFGKVIGKNIGVSHLIENQRYRGDIYENS